MADAPPGVGLPSGSMSCESKMMSSKLCNIVDHCTMAGQLLLYQSVIIVEYSSILLHLNLDEKVGDSETLRVFFFFFFFWLKVDVFL